MTSQIAVQREVEKLKERLLPKKDKGIVIVFSFGSDDEPHGKYGYRKHNIFTHEVEPVEKAIEIENLRENYETIPKHCKTNPDHVWSTFTKFLKYHECKCGKH